jgi:hypothetical protein
LGAEFCFKGIRATSLSPMGRISNPFFAGKSRILAVRLHYLMDWAKGDRKNPDKIVASIRGAK